MIIKCIQILAAALALAACTTTGNVERNAAGGAVLGAAAGAVVGNNVGDGNAGRGAAIGGVLGGAAGAARGYGQDQKASECRTASPNARQYQDYNTGAYYYYVPGSNRTCWSDGRARS